jgi:alpha-glucosidase (family GH31 glycosyl hydrolase)
MKQDPSSGKTLTYDAGNRFYIENLFSITHTPLERTGVDFWWLDWMGDNQSPFNKMGWMNELYYRHSEQSVPERNLRGQSFSRWADWGDQRHPIHFSGDTQIEWPTLQFEVPFTATAGNVGCFFWSHDIGGFTDKFSLSDWLWGTKKGPLIARWTQFGAVSPVLRLHSSNLRYLDKRPWRFSSDIEESMRRSFHLRSEIFPYIYSAAWEAHHDSLPLVRPLYLEFPELEKAYENSQEYFFGDALLAAPIVTEGDEKTHISSQKVWFPPGRWFDWFSGKEYKAKSEQTFSHDLNSFPLFARGGVPIVMQPYTERMTSSSLQNLIIRIYPGSNGQHGSAILYEDDGETKNYLQGDYALTHFEYQQAGERRGLHRGLEMSLTVSPEPTAFARPTMRDYEIQFVSNVPLKTARLGNTSLSVTYDPSQKINHIALPEVRSDETFSVQMSDL